MKPDTASKESHTLPEHYQHRAAVLNARIGLAMDGLKALRDTLQAIALPGGELNESIGDEDLEQAYDVWTALEAAVAGLESVTTRIGEQGDRLATYVPTGAPGLPLLKSVDDFQSLDKLIEAQHAALVALNEQIADAESSLVRARTVAPRTNQRYGAVEIQDVAGFLQESPIASIPVNASYYQRILEAARSPEGHKRPMGAILVEAGLITERQLENALAHQNEGRKRPLGTLLVDLGYTSDAAIAQTIAAQLALPFVSLAMEVVQQDALEVVPLHVARRHTCFPVSINDGALYVAMANPLDLIALEDLRLASRKHVRPCVASREEITGHIDRHYAGSVF